MVASLRQVFSALSRRGNVSLCRDILGFSNGRVPAAVNAARPKPQINVNQFVRLLRDKHFHVQLIVTGSDLLSENDKKALDYDIFRLRNIYSAAEIGIGIISWDLRTAQDSRGHAVVNPDGTVTIALGLSPTSGPCSPRADSGMNSSVVDFAGEPGGRALAHEVGHYLGASHPATPGMSLMTQDAAVRNAGGDPFTATMILENERTIMRKHCLMRPGLAV